MKYVLIRSAGLNNDITAKVFETFDAAQSQMTKELYELLDTETPSEYAALGTGYAWYDKDFDCAWNIVEAEELQEPKTKVYIAGPISGVNNFTQKFAEVEQTLNHIGFEVVNPAVLPLDTDYKECINRGLDKLFDCDAIFMLDGWEESQGATLEQQYAATVGMPIFYENSYEVGITIGDRNIIVRNYPDGCNYYITDLNNEEIDGGIFEAEKGWTTYDILEYIMLDLRNHPEEQICGSVIFINQNILDQLNDNRGEIYE